MIVFSYILAISTEKPLYNPTTDQHVALEDFSKEDLAKINETSQSDAVDQMEAKSTKGFFAKSWILFYYSSPVLSCVYQTQTEIADHD